MPQAGGITPGFTGKLSHTVLMRFVGRIFLPGYFRLLFCDTGGSYCWLGHLPIKTRQRFRHFIQMSQRCAPPGIVPRAPATAPAFCAFSAGRRRLSSRYGLVKSIGT